MSERLTAQWARVRARLRAEIGEATFRSLLKPLTLEELKDGEIFLSVPTRFMRDWIEAQYGERLLALWSKENSDVTRVDVAIAGPAEAATLAANAEPANAWTSQRGPDVARAAVATEMESARPWIRGSHSAISSSASRMNWHLPPPVGWPKL